jgi:hypothetical protein
LTETRLKDLKLVLTAQEAANNNGKSDLLALQKARIRELQKQIKDNDELQQARIDDLKIHIQAL